MSRLVVINHLTLDGVMQAPGRPGEDLRDGFEHGGWAQPRNDAVMADTMSRRFPAGRNFCSGVAPTKVWPTSGLSSRTIR